MHLLVIEDERALCETIVRSLRRLAYSVDYCYDGEKALELLSVERYDLVLLDLNLPGKDGMTVLRTLRQTDRETRVLILSARSEVEDATESSKCNTQREENFIRGFPAEAFAGTAVDHVRHAAKMLLGQGVKIVALWEEKAQQAVGVLVGAALPWLVRLSKVNRSADGCFKLPELRELRAVVQREAFYGHAFEHLFDCLPCFARVAAADN